MKSLLRVGLPVVLLGLLSVGLNAQVVANAPSSAQPPPPLLDHDEMMQLNAAREKVFAAHPDLKSESERLKALHESTPNPTPDQRDQAFLEWRIFRMKMHAALLEVDPTLKPILAKIDAAGAKARATK
jgi:hypothetical protein